MRRIVAAIFILMVLLCALPVQADSLQVVTLSSPPLAYNDNGRVTGIAVDLVREGLKRMGLEAEISICPWKRALHMARYGDADALFYAVHNPEREVWFHYPDEPLVVEATVPVKRFGEPVQIDPEKFDYSRISLGIGRGYYYGPKLKHFLENSRFRRIEEATTIESNFNKLVEGRIDVFLADLTLARHYIANNGAKGAVEIILGADGGPIILDSVDSFLVFSRQTVSRDVADRFSKTLKEMKADGTYAAILTRYE